MNRGLAVFLVAMLSSGCAPERTVNAKDKELSSTTLSWPDSFGVGRTATRTEIAAWDIDISADGDGLPAGSGTSRTGANVYKTKCASCHGPNGEGGTADRLVGRIPGNGFAFGRSYASGGEKTIGSYWPYATTLFDYTYRAMPQNAPGSLTFDEVYSLVAWLLFKNDIITEDFVVDADTLYLVEMPARDRFILDDRRGGPEFR